MGSVRVGVGFVVTLGFATGNDGFQEQVIVRFHIGNEMHITVDSDNKDPLAWVPILIGMLQHIQELAGFDGDHNRLEAKLSIRDELRIFLRAPRERLHEATLAKLCA
jgi:hypothetical protein